MTVQESKPVSKLAWNPMRFVPTVFVVLFIIYSLMHIFLLNKLKVLITENVSNMLSERSFSLLDVFYRCSLDDRNSVYPFVHLYV